MKSLKTLGVVAFLAAAAGGVYVSLHRPPQFPYYPQNEGGESAPSSAADRHGDGANQRGTIPEIGGLNVTLGEGLHANQAIARQLPPEGGGSQPASVEPFSEPNDSLGAELARPAQPAEGILPGTAAEWRGNWPGGTASADTSQAAVSSSGSLPGQADHNAAAASTPPWEGNPFSVARSSPPPRQDFATFMAEVNRHLTRGELAAALEKLSQRYDDPSLSPAEYEQIVDLLDQIAYAVIYSPESVLEPAYVVQQGDTLQRIAQSYGVPWQLLARINGISDPNALVPGQRLKVLRGPFDAEVDLKRREMTLKLHGLYAGRFALPRVLGADQLESTYFVEDKSTVPGDWWIRLSGGAEIRGEHALHQPVRTPPPAVLAVEADQIENLHTILSIGSRIRILR